MLRKLAAPMLLVLILAGCSGSAGPVPPPPSQPASVQVTVLAASSLTEVFTELAAAYETTHPGVTIALSFGPSDGLAQQIQQGAPADVFVSASTTWMDVVADDPGVTDRTQLATNRMAILVPEGNPGHIRTLEDLADASVRLVLCAEEVPCGDYARELLDNAGVDVRASLVSNEPDAAALASKVALGEADAAIAYVTDATPGTQTVQVPETDDVVATYWIAVPVLAPNAEQGARFLEFVTGPQGRQTLAAAGFEV